MRAHRWLLLAGAIAATPLARTARAEGPAGPAAAKPLFQFKPGTGLVVSSPDDRFSLSLRTRMQLRYDAEIPHEEGEEPDHVFQVRRMRIVFSGHAFGKHNKFYVQLGLSPRDMSGGLFEGVDSKRVNPVRDARVELDYLRDLTVILGQTKVPFSRQRVVSSGNLEMVDRSIVNEELNLDRDLGVQITSKDLFGLGRLAYAAGVFMGEGRNVFEQTGFGLLWVARVEWLPLGLFDDYTEGDLTRSARPGLSIGAAYAFHDDAPGNRGVHGARPADGGTTDYHHATADLMFKYAGLSAQLAFHYRTGTRNLDGPAAPDPPDPAGVELPRKGVGFLAQTGYLLPGIPLQIVGRYATVRDVDVAGSSQPTRSEIGAGLGYYFAGHPYKIQVDYTRLWDGVRSGEGGLENGTDRIRAQVQLSL